MAYCFGGDDATLWRVGRKHRTRHCGTQKLTRDSHKPPTAGEGTKGIPGQPTAKRRPAAAPSQEATQAQGGG